MDRLDWDSEKATWPNAHLSRFVDAGGLRWHVQEDGQPTDGSLPRKTMVLLHGTGASTHSWAGLMPLLAQHYHVYAFDLPGHGFTEPIPGSSFTLPNVAALVGGLLDQDAILPDLTIGHSAGAAIACRMALDNQLTHGTIVSLNGALLPFPGAAGRMMPALAKLIFVNPFVPRFFAWRARNEVTVDRLLKSTGSDLTEEQLDLYRRLFSNASHVDAALSMMANWDLHALEEDMVNLDMPVVLVVGSDDQMVPPDISERAHKLMPDSQLRYIHGLGHLAHEEAPDDVMAVIEQIAADVPPEA